MRDPDYVHYYALSAKQKIDDIAQRLAVLCGELAKTKPDAMWIIFWSEYGITAANNKVVSAQDAGYLQKKMFELTQKYPQLVIFSGTMAVKNEYRIMTEEEMLAARDHLVQVEESYRTPMMKSMRVREENSNEQEISSHHKAVVDLQKVLDEQAASLPSAIGSLTNSCFVFQNNKIIAEIHKMAPCKETVGMTGVVYYPKFSDHLVSLMHHKTGATFSIYVSICRETAFYLAEVSEKLNGKAFLHCSLSALGFVTSDKMRENFLVVDSWCYPRLIKKDANDTSDHLSVYQNNLLSAELTLQGPLQNLHPFESKMLHLFDHEIKKMKDAEAAAAVFNLRNAFANYLTNYTVTAKNLYEALSLWGKAFEQVATQQSTTHEAFVSHNRYGEHRLFARPLPQLGLFAQEVFDLVKTESIHNPEQRDIFPLQPAPIRMT